MGTQIIEAGLTELSHVAKTIISIIQKSERKVLLFRGELGAGKTTLIKNICNFLGVKDEVNSPTFSIVNEYIGDESEVIYHFDFYRIDNEEEALDMGIEEYFNSDYLCLIEWPENIEFLLPENRIDIKIIPDNKKRKFIISNV